MKKQAMRAYHHIVFVRDGMRLAFILGILAKSFDLTKYYKTVKLVKYYQSRRHHVGKTNIHRQIFVRHLINAKFDRKQSQFHSVRPFLDQSVYYFKKPARYWINYSGILP